MHQWFERVHVIERVGFGAERAPADLGAEGGRHGIGGALSVEFVVAVKTSSYEHSILSP